MLRMPISDNGQHGNDSMENLTAVPSQPTIDKTAIRRALGIFQEFRNLQPTMPIKTASIFTYIAANPGISMGELSKQTNTKQSTCSRIVAVLSEWEKYEVPGFGLVWTEDDPKERRRKLIHLTDVGEEFAAILAKYAR